MKYRNLGIVALLIWVFLPSVLDRHTVELIVFAGIYAIAGLGVGVLAGQCGIINLAQATFYGIGAYASAYCTLKLGYSAPIGFFVGILICSLIALTLGWPILRLTGYFLALATLAIGIIMNALFFEWSWLTGGELGIGGIPKLRFGEFLFDTPIKMYYLVWGVAFLCFLFVNRLVLSPTGLSLRAIRDAPDAARSLGIDLHRLRVGIFVLCASLGSLAGSLFAHHASFVSVHSFTVERSIVFLLIPVLGGITSIPGIVIGSLFVTFIPEILSKVGEFHQVLFGLALICVVVAAPAGIVGMISILCSRIALRFSFK